MSTKRIILISGYARSGKDTLANALLAEFDKLDKEATVTKFANALKSAVQLALNDLGLGHIDAFTEDPKLKALLRPLFVEVGKAARAIDKDVFVKRTLKDVGALLERGKETVMISDCRYLNEAHLVRRFGGERGINVERVSIARIGTEAANDEEKQSIEELNLNDLGGEGWTFPEGDTDGIKAWAKRIAGYGNVTVTASFEYAQPNKGTAKWTGTFTGPNGEPITLPHGVPVFGHTHDPRPAPVEQQLKALWDESLCLDESIDRVSQRLDTLSDMHANVDQSQRDIVNRLISIGLTLERLDARLKRLEVKDGNAIRWTLKFSGALKREGNLTTGTEYDLKHWPGYLEISDLQGYLIATMTWDATGYAGEPPIMRRARLDVFDLGKGEAMPTLLFSFVNEEASR